MKLAETCHRCQLANLGRTQVVWGIGPISAPVVFIGESPGAAEDAAGEPFVSSYRAKAGLELTKLLRDIGLSREQSYITNCVKCRPPDNRDPTEDEIDTCSMWLHMELDRLSPRVIVTVGRVSTRLVLGDVDMEQVHGIPYQVYWETLTSGDMGQTRRPTPHVTVVPVYHPAAGLHRPDLMMQVQADFEVIGQVLRGVHLDSHIRDQYQRPQYGEICQYDPAIMSLEMGAVMDSGMVAVDTEWARGKPWCMSYSHTPGTAAVISAGQSECLADVAETLADPSVTTVLHNALYDLPVLAQMGIHPANPADTMVMAYLLQSEPQGLKPLAYRYCGMVMTDYSDMVREATHRNVMRYLARVVEMQWPDPEPELVWEKDGSPRVRQSRNIISLATRILSDASFKDGVNVWERWNNIDVESGRGQVEYILGQCTQGDLSDIDRDSAVGYASRDADATLRLYPHLWKRIQANGLEDTFWRDMRAMPMVADMMRVGIGIDPGHFWDLSEYLAMRRDEILSGIVKTLDGMGISWDHFNPASPKDVAELFYDRGYFDLSKHIKKQDTGNETLARLIGMRRVIGSNKVRIVSAIRDWRSYAKLKGTYSDPMPKLADADNRVHSTFRITRTSTGRMSSSRPNIMAVPVRSAEGRLIRDGFVAGEGHTLISCDFSQIELRILAHMSQDSAMLHAFRTGVDIHTLTASRVWGVPLSQVDENTQRRPAKTLNFGIAYSMGPDGLQGALVSAGLDESDWPLDRCEELIQTWFGAYSGAREYLSGVKSHAMRHGWVADMFGRRRWIPHAQSPNKQLREEALRQAGNAPIQSGAGGIMKQSMGDLVPVYREWVKSGVVWWPLIQIHDDLVSEVDEGMLDVIVGITVDAMENAVELSVPVRVDTKVGQRWGSMVKYKISEQ